MTPGDIGLIVGAIVHTNYGTGPYIIQSIMTGCTCGDYISKLSGCPKEREPHIHITCKDADGKRRNQSYLGGYIIRSDGRILNLTLGIARGKPDEIFVDGFLPGTQITFEF